MNERTERVFWIAIALLLAELLVAIPVVIILRAKGICV